MLGRSLDRQELYVFKGRSFVASNSTKANLPSETLYWSSKVLIQLQTAEQAAPSAWIRLNHR